MEKEHHKKVGRPAKGIKKRGHQVNSAYNDMEFRLLSGKAEVTNLSLSEYQRQCALHAKVKSIFTKEQNLCLISVFNMEKNIRTLIKETRDLQQYTFNDISGHANMIVELLREWNALKDIIIKAFDENYDS